MSITVQPNQKLSIVFANQDQLDAWAASCLSVLSNPLATPNNQADMVAYIERAIELHKSAHLARSYVPVLTGEQREHLFQRGYRCGTTASGECCWFEYTR